MKKINIHQTVLIQLVLVGVLSILLLGYLWISSELSEFETQARTQKNTYLDMQKNTLKEETQGALAFITHMRSKTEDRLKDSIKERVYEAHAIATHIIGQNMGDKSVSEIKKMIKQALRPIRFKNNRGYFFAFDLNGIETLFPIMPEMEGKSMMKVTGGKGELVVPQMLDIVKKNDEGFYKYDWHKPGKKGYFPKIAFVKLLNPIGWVIGTGEYLDDVEADIKKECIEWISKIRFGNDGYVFAGQCDGLSLSGPQAGKNMMDVEDINGVQIVRDLISAARSGGGFVHYVLPRFEEKKHAPKISYAVGIPQWQWYVGAGVYVDEIEGAILGKRRELNRKIQKNIRNIVLTLVLLLIFIIAAVNLLSARMRNNLHLFTRFFDRAAGDSVKIEKAEMYFQEFEQLADSANRMLEKLKQTEEALQASHKRFLKVLDGIDATIYVCDLNSYEILFMNKYMQKIFGGDHTGKLCWKMFRNESGPCAHCTNETLLDENGNPGDVQVWQDKNPLTGKWYINYDRAIEWTDGRIVMLQIATDITEFKRMEEELRHAHKMESIGTLAGGIAHDFNNILSIIIGNVDLALSELPELSHAYQNILQVRTASLRARDIVKQLLSFSRKSDQVWDTIDIAQVVKESLKLVRSTIPSNIDIRQLIPDSSFIILADATQIHQVIINLCTNAVHSITDIDSGIIDVSLNNYYLDKKQGDSFDGMPPGKYVELVIRDNGSGIDSDLIGKIFDPYFTTKGIGEGTGMGLAVVHGIVKNHGGAISVESTPQKGTAFHLLFPEAADKPPLKTTDSTTDYGTFPADEKTILFIDDEASLTLLAERMLEKMGYRVHTSNHPGEALDMFTASPEKFDLVITDLTMPHMNGVALSEKLKAVRDDIPIIICTGDSTRVNEEKAKSAGIRSYVTKPITMSEIGSTIQKVLKP